jgi:hypothetical protein
MITRRGSGKCLLIRLGIANEVETAGSQSQLMLLILIATTPGLSPYH